MGPTTRIDSMNELRFEAYKDTLARDIDLKYASKSCHFSIKLETASTMSKQEMDACFDLIAFTSRSDYEQSTTKWRPRAKKAEMKHKDMRYLLVRETNRESVLGFASFMLTHENEKEVIYLYEVHLADEIRGLGLGKYLMDVVLTIGRNAKVEKMMLTVFVSNKNAAEWYYQLGFQLDEFWPEPKTLRSGIVKQADYRILSRSVMEKT